MGQSFKGNRFVGQRIDVDGCELLYCVFEDCDLRYSGGPPPKIVGCSFTRCGFTFADAAERTLLFMTAMYSGMGEGGRVLVEQTFENIRGGGPVPVDKTAN